ncbi:ATP phosphoribosyltransferase regulatory subunit [Labilithrix luteola]|uniref:ATP phosphoribosyltransferase regulatory subunit n=1 Tax=Labilithrix luteola TaxID=1391654 RepID=A0A0K1Q9Q6_9BACT|nr:ATP phosphoribosyltransferase regulatory subunit [Labilithrix luteola]AKV02526.1 ATP phosphoribosyltransferase regulatory subunit [Labilithrix luteola]
MTSGLPRSLEHPLPAGLRDLLPEEAQSRRALAQRVQSRFAAFGYRLVTPPVFELADVVERGLGTLSSNDVLRFVEPESGEVCVLRPDMTPQIARIVATRLRDHAPPFRLAYEGTVVRRRIGRAKKHRQIPQVGVELCGVAGPEADLELLELAADVLREVGLERFTIDVSDAGIVRELLHGVAAEHAEDVTRALGRKDEAQLSELTEGLATRDALLALVRLHGGREALVEAVALLASTRAAEPAKRLLALFDAAVARGLSSHLTADAGEVRGFAYYTGTIFSIYAKGPGEPIGAGGRYDELLSRFGAPMPAIGLGLDLDALGWARKDAGMGESAPDGVVVVGAPDDPRLRMLRERSLVAVALSTRELATSYARSWRFAAVWDGTSLFDPVTNAPLGKSASVTSVDEAFLQTLAVLRSASRGD